MAVRKGLLQRSCLVAMSLSVMTDDGFSKGLYFVSYWTFYGRDLKFVYPYGCKERSNVPKFGNWEGEENVPYTAYFEKARKVRAPGGRVVNPNDPEYYSDSQSQATPPSRTKPEEVDPSVRSQEESELKQFGGGGLSNKRQGRASQNNNSYDKSPLHKNSKPILKADESPEKVTVVPKFGDWDENNPASADGYTHIFNKVREERSSGANASGSSTTPTHPNSRNNPSNTSKCCCFGFGGK